MKLLSNRINFITQTSLNKMKTVFEKVEPFFKDAFEIERDSIDFSKINEDQF